MNRCAFIKATIAGAAVPTASLGWARRARYITVFNGSHATAQYLNTPELENFAKIVAALSTPIYGQSSHMKYHNRDGLYKPLKKINTLPQRSYHGKRCPIMG